MNGRGSLGEIRKNALARRDDDGSLSHFFYCVRFTTNLLHTTVYSQCVWCVFNFTYLHLDGAMACNTIISRKNQLKHIKFK